MKQHLTFHFVENVDEVLRIAVGEPPAAARKAKPARNGKGTPERHVAANGTGRKKPTPPVKGRKPNRRSAGRK